VKWLTEQLSTRSDVSFEVVDLRDLPLSFFDSPVSPARGQVAPEAEGWAAQVERAEGFIFVSPEYNHGYPAVLKNAIDHLYLQWVHKPAAIVTYGGAAAGYRAAEQLRQVFVEVKMVPIREQIGISLVPGFVPNIDDSSESVSGKFLERVFNAMMDELLWWATALTPARHRSSQE
jgi:NAD(P)H-dependent FMN reductase